VTFVSDHTKATVAGFGLDFVDVDNPQHRPSGLSIYDASGERLAVAEGFRTRSGETAFRGIIVADKKEKLMPVVSRVQILNGGGWPAASTKTRDGVVLDDFVFGVPVVAPKEEPKEEPKSSDEARAPGED